MLLTVFRFLPGKGLAARAGVLALVLLAICAPFAALAAPRQQAPGNGPVIFVPNDGFATVTLRDASSLDVRASAYLPTPNTSASALADASPGSWPFSMRWMVRTLRPVSSASCSCDQPRSSLMSRICMRFILPMTCLPGNDSDPTSARQRPDA